MDTQKIMTDLKAAYCAGKAAAQFDLDRAGRMKRELAAIEQAARALRNRLEIISQENGADDGWHH